MSWRESATFGEMKRYISIRQFEKFDWWPFWLKSRFLEEWIAKTCSRISVDDCKTANRVKYCYCKTDRCNMQNFTVSTTTTGAMTVETIETTTSAAPSSTTTPAVDKLHHTTSRLRPMDSTRKSNSSIRKSDHWLILSCLLILIFRLQNKLNFTDKLYKWSLNS